jgi:ribonuclease HI
MKIFTDGACSKNGMKFSRAGMGVYQVLPEKKISISVVDFITKNPEFSGVGNTNNVGELLAIYIALSLEPKPHTVSIYSDSMYSIKCLTVWHKTWSNNNWLNSRKQPVKNKFIIQKIIESMKDRQVFFLHVRSHKKAPEDTTSLEYEEWFGNDQADKLATNSIFLAL